jgi:hypothetical protein
MMPTIMQEKSNSIPSQNLPQTRLRYNPASSALACLRLAVVQWIERVPPKR